MFSSQNQLETQRDREKLSFAHSHQNIVESLEISAERGENCWYLYVLTPYMTSLKSDFEGRKQLISVESHYKEATLMTYLKELVTAFAYLQSKVRAM